MLDTPPDTHLTYKIISVENLVGGDTHLVRWNDNHDGRW